MPKDLTARNRIAAYLSNNGPIDDPDGRATALLKDAVGYSGTSLGFVQLISSMEKAGHISRDVRGKRTYRIASVSAPGSVPAPAAGYHPIAAQTGDGDGAPRVAIDLRSEAHAPDAAESHPRRGETGVPGDGVGGHPQVGDIDYDRLAAALLAQVTKAVTARTDPAQPTASVRRRLDQLAARNTELEREAARARAERDAVAAERDELRSQLEAASHNLNLLTERLGTPRRPQGGAADRLGSEERALLYRLSERSADSRREAVG